ncbi:MAG: hypothetical protein WC423_19075 [Vulcanimicrobiota bacterium]
MTVGFLALSIALGLYATLMHGAFRAEGTGMNWNLTLLEPLRRELSETSLVSVSCYSGLDGAELPGVSFLSAAEPGEEGGGQLNQFGRPTWRKKVYYVLQGVEVIRWEEALESPTDGPPFRFPAPLSAIPSGINKDVLGRGMLEYGRSIEVQPSKDGKPDTYSVVKDASSAGGFQVQFVRRKSDGSSELSYQNPTDWTEEVSTRAEHTGLVQVSLVLAETIKETGLTGQVLTFRVKPRN